MSTRTLHHIVDDLDGTVLPVGEGTTVEFALDGDAYEIDLTDEHAAELLKALEPYIAAARRLPSPRLRSKRATPNQFRPASRIALIRAWANAQGYELGDRGRIPANVITAFDAAH